MADSKRRLHGTWASRWTFILAATGSAVGLGNIWKFPYIAGENGGGAFVLIYLLCILLVGVPVMMAEVMLGRRGRMSPVNAMRAIVRETGSHRLWGGIGWLGVAAGLMILSYYGVIAGWALYYIVEMANGSLQGAGSREVVAHFSALLDSPGKLIFWQTLFMLLTIGVVVGGVTRGLGVAVRVLMPLLFVLLVLLVLYAARQGDFAAGFSFLFSFRVEHLSWTGVLEAMGQAFFSLSLGMGAIMAYGAYMPDDAPIGRTVVTVASLDTLVALMVGLAIFPIVFASPGVEPDAGPVLMFQTLPVVFGNMTGGLFFGTLFFLLVSVAAWSSSISLVEPGVAWLIESKGMNRLSANLLFGVTAWVLGLGSVLSFNLWQDYRIGGETFFGVMDFVTSNIMLPLTGLLIAVFVGWLMQPGVVFEALGDKAPLRLVVWRWLLRFVAPVAIAVIFLFGLYSKFF